MEAVACCASICHECRYTIFDDSTTFNGSINKNGFSICEGASISDEISIFEGSIISDESTSIGGSIRRKPHSTFERYMFYFGKPSSGS